MADKNAPGKITGWMLIACGILGVSLNFSLAHIARRIANTPNISIWIYVEELGISFILCLILFAIGLYKLFTD